MRKKNNDLYILRKEPTAGAASNWKKLDLPS